MGSVAVVHPVLLLSPLERLIADHIPTIERQNADRDQRNQSHCSIEDIAHEKHEYTADQDSEEQQWWTTLCRLHGRLDIGAHGPGYSVPKSLDYTKKKQLIQKCTCAWMHAPWSTCLNQDQLMRCCRCSYHYDISDDISLCRRFYSVGSTQQASKTIAGESE